MDIAPGHADHDAGDCLGSSRKYVHIHANPPPNALESKAFAINDLNQIGGVFTRPNEPAAAYHGFLLSGGTYTTVDVPNSIGTAIVGTAVDGISNLGDIVGNFQDSTGVHSYLLSGGTFTKIDVPGATGGTFANAINDTGRIGGVFTDTAGDHAFLLSAGILTTFDVPGATTSSAIFGMNDLGQIVGAFVDTKGLHGYLLSGGMFAIDVPNANYTQAFGINDLGVISGAYSAGGKIHGFELDGGVFSTIDVPNTFLGTALFKSNDAGLIVGDSDFGLGTLQIAFLATPVPEPGSWLILATGLVSMLGYCWRRKQAA